MVSSSTIITREDWALADVHSVAFRTDTARGEQMASLQRLLCPARLYSRGLDFQRGMEDAFCSSVSA